ncbi:flagellar motor protein [Kineosporia sp. NBRC 101731]|uniref:flagellar motor protein n=1 Tax=Kineosporia sp. NBRC 101731 TaxID=3032199 RepID=UPI0024A55171|nr:flagellar motor protein [Kineosporia sp. NBRC 101731]GLY27007.1 motility protein A [Kineosporia sp. NBRC 101731]
MDVAMIAGLVVSLGAIFTSMILEGSSPMAIFLIPAIMLVIVGTLGACMASGTIASMMTAFKWLIYAFTAKPPKHEEVVEPLVKMAEKARREGLLSLESEMDSVEDPFMQRGLQMAVDGTDPDDLYDILMAEVRAKKASAAVGAAFWTDAGGYAPTIGIVGTVIGLIHVLENLSEPEKLGHLIAGAFVATLWGVMSANVMFLPWAKRIKYLTAQEAAKMELVIDGVLAIQAGSNPRVVATKLRSKMTPAGPNEVREAA